MNATTFQVDDFVTIRNKTGEYIGRIFEMRGNHSAVVEVQAVLSHPTQGDLHHPNRVDVPLFHQRRAMSFKEKTVIPVQMLKPYKGDIPEYKASLKEAFDKKLEKLNQRNDDWAQASIKQLEDLRKDYFSN